MVFTKQEALHNEIALHNEVTMEEAIAQLTSSYSQQTEQSGGSQDVTHPTSVMVELTSVQQLQQPTVVSVDVQPLTVHASSRDHVSTSITRQESLNDQMTSHQVTMEKAITQVTSQHTSTVAKGSETTNQISASVAKGNETTNQISAATVAKGNETTNQISAATVAKGNETTNQISAATVAKGSGVANQISAASTVVTTTDEVDNTIEAVSSEMDFDFSDILSGLRELSGEDDFTLDMTTPEKPAAKKTTSSVNQSAKKTEYHTMSLFSDVPITVPPKAEQPISKGKSTSFQRTVPVNKEDDQYRSLTATPRNIDSTVVSRTTNVARQQSSLSATVPTTKESMKSVTMTINKAVEISVAKKPTSMVTSSKESVVTMTTGSKIDEGKGQRGVVPLAVSHKREMQQQKDGTDIEWDIDMGDLDIDLASQLEELNSIIGQLGGLCCIVLCCVVCMCMYVL